MRTSVVAGVFAVFLALASAGQSGEHAKARRAMAEVERTNNPVRLLMLALDIRKSLDKALAGDPDNVEVRLDFVRFHVNTPRIAGGDMSAARAHAAEIAKRDEALGHFARGYIAYRGEKAYGAARLAFRAAIERADEPATKALAMRWLGWLSQETQQWQTAFEIWEALGDEREVKRTEAFCRCSGVRRQQPPL